MCSPPNKWKKTTKIRPPTSLQFLDSRPLPHPTYLLFMCSKKRNRNLIVMNIQNDEWKNPAMFCHRVNNVNKKCEQLWTNDMKVVWNMLKNESHRIEIKHILQKKKSFLVRLLKSIHYKRHAFQFLPAICGNNTKYCWHGRDFNSWPADQKLIMLTITP